jgi:dTDP-4-dehydrorhamnose reductase
VKILIFGGDGMLGHRLRRMLAPRHDVRVTLRSAPAGGAENASVGIDARNIDAVTQVLNTWRPEAVVNCIGVVKQRSEANDAIVSIEINALWPHRLAAACRIIGARMVHLSTDCVFSGEKGRYTEEDVPDPHDLYGRTKLLGEVAGEGCVTLRTSIIGTELGRRGSLIEWYLAQRGQIRGFTRAIYTGFTTQEMSRIIERVLLQHPELSGLWHVASEPIDKCDLLMRLTRLLGRRDVTVVPDSSFVCDRSLIGTRFEKATGYHAPGWDAMLQELATAIKSERNGEWSDVA